MKKNCPYLAKCPYKRVLKTELWFISMFKFLMCTLYLLSYAFKNKQLNCFEEHLLKQLTIMSKLDVLRHELSS